MGLRLHCGRIAVKAHAGSMPAGPVLLASNHPNSFLDALILATHLPWRMHFLARGDAFRKPWAARLLRGLYMLPVYRMSEGRAELRRTERSLSAAFHVLEEGRSVLMFPEGISRTTMALQPLGKGTARIALRAWRAGRNVPVLPVRLYYSSFHRPFPEVMVSLGEPILPADVPITEDAAFLNAFNQLLRERLVAAAPEPSDANGTRPATRMALALPALAGWLLHAPWYFPMRFLAACWPKDPLFFDSVLFAWLLLTYPLWLLALTGIGLGLGLGGWAWMAALVAPVTLPALRNWMRG